MLSKIKAPMTVSEILKFLQEGEKCHILKDTSPKLKLTKAILQSLLGHIHYMRSLSNKITSLGQSPLPTFDQSLLRYCTYIISMLMPSILR